MMSESVEQTAAPIIAPNPLLVPTWIKGHYHCRKCGGEMECWKMFRWAVKNGVSRIGGCVDCGQIFVEYEKSPPKWLEVEL